MVTIWSLFAYLNYVINPFYIIFKSVLTQGIFPSEWKKANVVTVHKKRQCVKNYIPVSLLSVCSKVFEHIIYNTMFPILAENNLIHGTISSYPIINQDLSLEILVSINYQPLLTKYLPALMAITKLEGYSLTFEKLSMKYGTRQLFINLNALGPQGIY